MTSEPEPEPPQTAPCYENQTADATADAAVRPHYQRGSTDALLSPAPGPGKTDVKIHSWRCLLWARALFKPVIFLFFFFHWQKYSKSPGRNVRVDQDLVLASLLLDISKWDGLYQGRSFITRRPWRSTSRAARLPLVSANRIDEAFASNHRDSLNYFSGTAPPLNASNSRLRQTNSIGAPIVWV